MWACVRVGHKLLQAGAHPAEEAARLHPAVRLPRERQRRQRRLLLRGAAAARPEAPHLAAECRDGRETVDFLH